MLLLCRWNNNVGDAELVRECEGYDVGGLAGDAEQREARCLSQPVRWAGRLGGREN